MAYIKSKDIQLFPSAFRGQYSSSEGGIVFNPASRLTTEYNLTTLSARASRFHQSYVLDYKAETVDKTIIFNIKGYLFEIKMASYLLDSSFSGATSIWAKIKLKNLASDDINNTVDTNPVLSPVEGNGTILDELDAGPVEGNFLGLSLETDDPTLEAEEYKLLILERVNVNDDWDVPAKSYFRMSAKEISDSGDETKSINKKFTVEEINAEKINGLTITPADDATLTIANTKTLTASDTTTLATNTITLGNGKKLTLSDDTTLATNALTLKSGKALTMQHAGLTVGGSNKTGDITLTSSNADARTLTLTGSPSLSGITTTGTGTLVLGNKTLTANSSITLAGTDNKTLTVNDNITVGTNAITLQSGKLLTMQYAGLKVGGLNKTGDITLASNNNTSRTLTLTGSPSLSGITTTGSGTLTLNKNLTVANTNNITLEAAGADRILKISGANKELAGAGTSLTIDNSLDIAGTTAQITLGTNPYTLKFTTTGNTTLALPTTGKLATIADINNLEQDIFYDMPMINNWHSFGTDTSIYAPTTGGTAGYLLKATNATSAPTWVNPSTITVGSATNATNATNTAFTNANWAFPVAINGTLPSSVLGKTLEIGVMYDDSIPRYYNFGIITLRSLGGIYSEWYVGAVYAGGEIYSLTIDSNGSVYFKNGTTRITDDDYKLHYRIIT